MADDHWIVAVPGGWQAYRAYFDKRHTIGWEWFTKRGWRRVRGGSVSQRGKQRKPSDVVTFRVFKPQEGKA